MVIYSMLRSPCLRLKVKMCTQVHMGVVAMGQDCNYQLDTTKLGKKEVTLGVCGIWPIYLRVALCLRTALGRGILAIYHTSLGLIS
jgi:hypothetical protein